MTRSKQTTNPFSEAVHQTKELLESMRQGLGPYPMASKESINRLSKLAKIAPLASAKSQVAIGDSTLTPSIQEVTHVASSIESQVSLTKAERAKRLAQLREEALACVRCPHLVASRTQVVFGIGNPDADLMFVGEAPGADEDAQGEPFVGRAGQLLTKIIEAMGLKRSDIYIANILKCRPNMPEGQSGNRKPRAEEMATCIPWLKEQIKLIQPKALVALGATAVEGLLGKTPTMRDTRGRWFTFENIPVMVTYHPAYLLRNQTLTEKRKVWEDLLKVMERLHLPISERQRNFFLTK